MPDHGCQQTVIYENIGKRREDRRVVHEVILLKNLLYFLTCLAIAMATTTSLSADGDGESAREISRLLTQGEILPLASILEIVRPITGVHVLEVEVEHEDFGLVYEIYFLDPQGLRREIYVDARTGKILMQKLDD